ncbi:hypothetical protein [Bradyrhizobium zhanjiangense]|uniref:Uncharacterized protein n=1 Tax=Bradyrhizobium zhanjiangense TaxID=1325107 RepID=A0A4Q0SNE9_9BRAD|nr:hypothetical protein [Bradyrhizobium zhanjiangense]RXH41313.1 hypothetical protein XH94_09010 [Bradyrhizobium zhanjiangense]
MEPVENRAVLLLASGHILKVAGVLLYPAGSLAEIATIRAQAAEKLGGVSTGIGFIGSPGWAIGAGAALGLLEGAMTSAARKDAVLLLQRAREMEQSVLAAGLLFRVGEINGIARPTPAGWTATVYVDDRVYLKPLDRRQRAQLLSKHRKTEADVIDHTIVLSKSVMFASNGDDFLTVDTDIGVMDVRWSSVVSYLAPTTSPPPLPPQT